MSLNQSLLLILLFVDFLALVGTVSLGEINLETRIHNFMKPLPDGDISLMLLLDSHDTLDLALTLIDSLLHLLIVAFHLVYQSFIVILLTDYRREATL